LTVVCCSASYKWGWNLVRGVIEVAAARLQAGSIHQSLLFIVLPLGLLLWLGGVL
jgi:hypothetical protein